ncbi:PTS mannose transporter subunit IID [Lactiplantibacillus garii]|uniref:PTS mannose transporter subunit IID n=2 Tax=Lactiplantibacillus garii TaxID=2306423 RepID=A0A3R8KKW7_9LACO|nr:PTS mannose transporter subunit IID [Lactiplantibacillus garii]
MAGAITKKDLNAAFRRSCITQAAWNYERMHGLGFCYEMIPAIKRIYPAGPERAAALKRHNEFMNSNPYMEAPILGVTIAMEEKRAQGAPIDDAAIDGVKVGMMGPLAGVGDPIFWGTLRPVLAAFGASLAATKSIMGPIIFFVAWNVIRLGFRYWGVHFGYQQGTNIVNNLKGNLLQKLTEGASILGLFIMGVLVPRWTTMKFPMVVSRVTTNGKTTVTTLNDIFNELLPGLMPLLLTFLVMWLLKRKVNAIWIIFGLFIVGILGYGIGLFGI